MQILRNLKYLVLLGSLALWCSHAASGELKLSEISSDPEALFSLAIRYEHAEGVEQDEEKALDLYCQAARLDYANAQYALGWMYANGRGIKKDDKIAAQLFTLAAEQGHKHAKKMMRFVNASKESALPECFQFGIDEIDQESWVDYSNNSIFKMVKELAPRYHLDPYLVMAVISIESAFNVQAVSHKNAQGLMQLIPATAERFQVKDSFDAKENIKGGMAYLRWLLAFFKGDVTLVTAAYNAGEGAVEKYRGIPPYPETQNYVKKIKERYKRPTHPYQPNIVNKHALTVTSGSD